LNGCGSGARHDQPGRAQRPSSFPWAVRPREKSQRQIDRGGIHHHRLTHCQERIPKSVTAQRKGCPNRWNNNIDQ
jgi:hypothetical protein